MRKLLLSLLLCLSFFSLPATAQQPIDTTGFRPLMSVQFTKRNDPGTGVVPMGPWSNANLQVETGAPAAPFLSAARWKYKAGFWGGTSPAFMWAVEAPLRNENVHDTYFRAYFKWSSNWYGHSGGGKNMLLGWGPGPSGGNQFILSNRGSQSSATGNLLAGISWQSGGSMPTSYPVGQPSANPPNPTNNFTVLPNRGIKRDTWVKIELVAHSGPTGSKTSWFQIWKDDTLTAQASGFDFTPTSDSRLTEVKLAPVWGGGASLIPSDQYMWMADMVLLGK